MLQAGVEKSYFNPVTIGSHNIVSGRSDPHARIAPTLRISEL